YDRVVDRLAIVLCRGDRVAGPLIMRNDIPPGSHPRDVYLATGQRYCDAGPVGRGFERVCDAELLSEVFEERIESLLGFARVRLQWPDRKVEGVGRLHRSTGERQRKNERQNSSGHAVDSASIQVHAIPPKSCKGEDEMSWFSRSAALVHQGRGTGPLLP